MQTTMIFPGEVFAATEAFDAGIRMLLPYYEELLTAIARGVSPNTRQILELGCGTGELSLKLLQRCPQLQLTALDYSPRMIAAAEQKLEPYRDRVTFIHADFGDWALGNISLAATDFGAVVSSLAIHHLTDEMKQTLFQCVYRQLEPGGWFWNADPVLSPDPDLEAVYQAARSAWTERQGETLEQVRAQIGKSDRQGHSSQDQLATLDQQLQWLQNIGFQPTEVLWKYYGLAVFGGRKVV